ncbi:MAG TPA: hypothetical protein VGO09_00070 [Flavisolibacter sp.]|nr:hypothetical protein [Flavisolibacter sp.]
MKRLTISSLVIAVVLMVTAVSCTAVRYNDPYESGYYANAPFYSSIDPFTGFYYNSAPYGYYSSPYINGYYGGRGYYNSRPRLYRRNENVHEQRNWHQGTQQRNWNSTGNQQNRSDSRTRVFGNRR